MILIALEKLINTVERFIRQCIVFLHPLVKSNQILLLILILYLHEHFELFLLFDHVTSQPLWFAVLVWLEVLDSIIELLFIGHFDVLILSYGLVQEERVLVYRVAIVAKAWVPQR